LRGIMGPAISREGVVDAKNNDYTKTEDRVFRVAVIALVTANFQLTFKTSRGPILSNFRTIFRTTRHAASSASVLNFGSLSLQIKVRYLLMAAARSHGDCQKRWYP
jgi:hypothetical protein